MRVEIEGLDRLINLLTKGGTKASHALKQAMYKEAAEAFAESQFEVPVDKGFLRSSGQAYGIQVDESAKEIVYTIGYGGVAAPYALIVHEDLEARHNAPTKAKYLEDPVKRRAQGMGNRLGDAVENALRSSM